MRQEVKERALAHDSNTLDCYPIPHDFSDINTSRAVIARLKKSLISTFCFSREAKEGGGGATLMTSVAPDSRFICTLAKRGLPKIRSFVPGKSE
jgi:hypothetical protein